jgi:hypothetical protein
MLVFPYLFQLLQFYSRPWPIRVTERGWIRSVLETRMDRVKANLCGES